MGKELSRRNLLKTLGLATGGLLTLPLHGFAETNLRLHIPITLKNPAPDKPVTAITLGAGNRGNVYGEYALKFPDHLKIVGVADPNQIRNKRYSQKHNIPMGNSFKTWEDVFEQPKFADAIIITTPDNLHFGPCMKALAMGYDILLEKPIAPTEKECRKILALAKETNRVVAVCHVLRYSPYFIKLRELIQNGSIGELISVQHFEPIQHIHMSHSYVRGNWHNSTETTPIILAKSCHDLDILRWMIGSSCEKIAAFGDLKWFRKENKPVGATPRCIDGCTVEKECPYSALKIYYRDRQRTHVFDLPDEVEKHGEVILDRLKTTNYGRCVYQMDNDQPDHYTTNLQFSNGVTASFNMEAFTSYEGRRTRIMGSHGDIVGDMSQFTYTNFLTGEKTEWKLTSDAHGGGDWNLVADWVQAVSQQNSGLLSSSIDVSVESHIIGFTAEKSRLSGKIKKIVV
ncbi:Gfo/Idh/MocA family protein [Flavobacterium lacustre]|uniref:Gfo/Idh/MocA family protein n=1 Tax=Flavobacterium lacustre TaxID=3016339 RepID=UPI0022B663B3|nr:Gfo/Idh/MocA family oxidoreductase [Flavobacterium lacustre]